ncbi:hypothetical protein CNYM01_01103 [Colletotrichum nymphaeae SA-01]|uniref:Uncharacterized protein n=1 Tax=Colletotrichum nymphaeae SA-01 TaxID=1460502 RepID=A0A135SEG0_9PEZI|nr:hypothetical protein CNYM01_01103 [Colletotrichum nymphaeae SA-01]
MTFAIDNAFALAILGEHNPETSTTKDLILRTLGLLEVLEVYLSIRERLIHGECILPSPQSTMRASRLDPSVTILFGTGPTFPAAESDVGEFPDNILNGEYEEDDEDDREAGLPNSGPIKKGKRAREEDDSSPSTKTKRARKDKGKGL